MTNAKIRTTEQIIDNIIDYFENNEDIFNQAIEELDGYNGYLGDDRYYDMYDLDEFYRDTEPSELLYRAFYGYDEDSYITDEYGTKHYESFNPNRDYFRYNGYGNLVSADYKDYSAQLDEYAIFSILDNIDYIGTIADDEDLKALFAELQSAYDNQDE